MSADHELAKKSSQDILNTLRLHPFSRHLIGNQRELEVRKDSFFVRGHKDSRNHSVKAKGILSNVTGGRADYIIFDDVEVAKNSGDSRRREELRRRIAEVNNLLVPEMGRRLFIGTYHDSESVYDELINIGASKLKVPLIKNVKGEFPYQVGDSQWPERFNQEWILQKQTTCHSKAEWQSQYLLIPSSVTDSLLDVTRVRMYEKEVDFTHSNGSVLAKIGDAILRSVSCWWDPAISSARGDDSVVAIVFSDDDNNYYIHRTVHIAGDTDEQCRRVKIIALEHNIPVVSIESNGIGALLPPMLIKHLEGTGVGVDAVYNSARKNDRIIQAFETPLYAGKIHAHASVVDGPFLYQLRDFKFENTKTRDDFIDATASAILREPIRLAAAFSSFAGINKNWMAQGTYDLEMDELSF
jgi:phage terminase large subunit-like protein